MTYILFFLILITAYSAFQIIKEIIGMHECPDEALLKKVITGRVKGDSRLARKIKKHLGVCETCRDKVHDIIK